MAWTKMDGGWVYTTRGDVWAEVLPDKGKWYFEVTDGKRTFHQSEDIDTEGTAKAAAKKIYDDLVAKPPQMKTPTGDTWSVKLPGMTEAQTTKAMSALQAVGFILHRNPGYSHQGLTVGEDRANFRLVFTLIRDLVQVRKVNP